MPRCRRRCRLCWTGGLGCAEQGKLIRGVYHNVRVNIERHTEFTSITLIEESQDTQSLASALPTGWTAGISGDIVVAVDCNVRARDTQTARQWVCASALEGGRATAYFNFRVADDGHTKILLEFAPDCDPRDIGRVSLQVLEIETYRCFAALGLPGARRPAKVWEIADMIPSAPPDLDNQSEASERFQILSKLAGELEEIWRDTSFRFNACFAYWGLVQARWPRWVRRPMMRAFRLADFWSAGLALLLLLMNPPPANAMI